MTILARLGALTALAACGTGTSQSAGPSIDPVVTETLAAAAAITPASSADFASAKEAITSDLVGDGLHGYAASSDGEIVPVRIRVSEDANTAYVSLNGGPEVAYATGIDVDHARNYGFWNNESSDQAQFNYNGPQAYPLYVVSRGAAPTYRGYTGLHTPVSDLPEADVTYAGLFQLAALGGYLEADMTALVDFGTGLISGSLDGAQGSDFMDVLMGGGTRFTSDLSGAVSENQIAMTSSIEEEGLTGNLQFMGGVFDTGSQIAGGVAGTVNDDIYSGFFSASEATPE